MDLRKLKKLIDLVQESGIGEIEITEGEEKVRISRQSSGAPVIMAGPMAQPLAIGAPAAGAAPPPAPEPEAKGHTLKSPMVGTLYRAPAPGPPAFVSVGQCAANVAT